MNKEEQEAIEVLESFEYREKTKQYNKLDLGDVRTSKTILNLIDRLQKNNKELNLENQALYESINCNDDNMLAREYQKLKEELEQVKEKNKELKELLDNEVAKMSKELKPLIKNEFISKDKIKDKIKFLDKNIQLQWASTSYNEIDVEKYQYALEILENLLKEE